MHPDPIFTIFGRGVYLYGVCIAVGIILCFLFLVLTMRYKKFNEASSDAIIFIGIFGTGFGFLSAMVFQGFYNWIAGGEFNLGSMTFLGGLIGGTLGFLAVWNIYVYLIKPRTKIKWLNSEMNAGLCDALPFIPIGITIAHAFGRFGCFWAGCCYGMETDAWYGLPCAGNYEVSGFICIPTQLFEMVFLLALATAMAVLYFRFNFKYNCSVYAIAYGIWRFFIEFIRGDERGELFPGSVLSPSQIWSIAMVLLGVGYIFLQMYIFNKRMKHPELSKKPSKTSTKTA